MITNVRRVHGARDVVRREPLEDMTWIYGKSVTREIEDFGGRIREYFSVASS